MFMKTPHTLDQYCDIIRKTYKSVSSSLCLFCDIAKGRNISMILVLFGTQSFAFNRLAEEIELLISAGLVSKDEQIVMQTGVTVFAPQYPNIELIPFLARDQYNDYIEKARIIVTHGGAGSIFDSLQRGKQVVALARKLELNEHIDNHQFELLEVLYKNGYIIAEKTLNESFKKLSNFTFKPYETKQKQIIEKVKQWINE